MRQNEASAFGLMNEQRIRKATRLHQQTVAVVNPNELYYYWAAVPYTQCIQKFIRYIVFLKNEKMGLRK